MNSKLGDFFFSPVTSSLQITSRFFFFLSGLSGYYINLVILIHSHLFYSLFVCLTNQASLISLGLQCVHRSQQIPRGSKLVVSPL